MCLFDFKIPKTILEIDWDKKIQRKYLKLMKRSSETQKTRFNISKISKTFQLVYTNVLKTLHVKNTRSNHHENNIH